MFQIFGGYIRKVKRWEFISGTQANTCHLQWVDSKVSMDIDIQLLEGRLQKIHWLLKYSGMKLTHITSVLIPLVRTSHLVSRQIRGLVNEVPSWGVICQEQLCLMKRKYEYHCSTGHFSQRA